MRQNRRRLKTISIERKRALQDVTDDERRDELERLQQEKEEDAAQAKAKKQKINYRVPEEHEGLEAAEDDAEEGRTGTGTGNGTGNGRGRRGGGDAMRTDTRIDYEETDKPRAFCCADCHWSPQRREKYGHVLFTTDQDTPPHLRCCHAVHQSEILNHTDFQTPLLQAIGQVGFVDHPPQDQSQDLSTTHRTLLADYSSALKQQSNIYMDDQMQDAASLLNTSDAYCENRKHYSKLPRRSEGAVVLDCFAGIGTALVALKRLSIHVAAVIHVEHDRVASFCIKANHEPRFVREELVSNRDRLMEQEGHFALPDHEAYRSEQAHGEEEGDEITHIFIRKFKSIQRDPRKFLKWLEVEHGISGIDIVIGGPPCVDFTGVNANRQGTHGSAGKCTPEFGRFISEMQTLQNDRHIHFVAENVQIPYKELKRILPSYPTMTWDPLVVDARDYSPCKRKRVFFSNIPFSLSDEDLLDMDVHGDDCLEDGYQLPGTFWDPGMVTKANTFLASKSRIDTPQMVVYKQQPQQQQQQQGRTTTTEGPPQDGGNDEDNEENKRTLLGRFMTAGEREAMMGFPTDYVQRPVRYLFKMLHTYGYMQSAQGAAGGDGNDDFRTVLPPYLQENFAGNMYHHKTDLSYAFAVDPVEMVRLKLAAPLSSEESLKLVHYTDDEYMKRLIGNAFSVPVMELLLRPLQEKFPSWTYRGYDYVYKWQQKDPPGQLQTVNTEVGDAVNNWEASGSDEDAHKPAAVKVWQPQQQLEITKQEDNRAEERDKANSKDAQQLLLKMVKQEDDGAEERGKANSKDAPTPATTKVSQSQQQLQNVKQEDDKGDTGDRKDRENSQDAPTPAAVKVWQPQQQLEIMKQEDDRTEKRGKANSKDAPTPAPAKVSQSQQQLQNVKQEDDKGDAGDRKDRENSQDAPTPSFNSTMTNKLVELSREVQEMASLESETSFPDLL